MLAELMRLKHGIAIAGTHGKTTTTSLTGALLTDAGLDPTVIVGGRLRLTGTGARLGKSELMVVEADEFDRSFLSLAPIVAVVTNIDRDHLDTYRDVGEIEDAFVRFASRVPFFGQVIACADDAGVQQALPRLSGHRVVTYGLSPTADVRAERLLAQPGGSRFAVVKGGTTLGEIELPMPGLHNVRNALAALAVGLALALEVPAMARSLAAFAGVHRRFERLGAFRGATVIDDYAHHPTEVAATLAAARQAFPRTRIFAVFQPHLYSRTRDLAEEFGRVLLGADRVLVTDVYASREAPVPGVTGELVVTAAHAAGHGAVAFSPDWREVEATLRQEIEPGDLVLTLGAGDIYRLAEELIAAEAAP